MTGCRFDPMTAIDRLAGMGMPRDTAQIVVSIVSSAAASEREDLASKAEVAAAANGARAEMLRVMIWMIAVFAAGMIGGVFVAIAWFQ